MGSRPDSGQGMERTPDSGHVFTYVRIPWDDSLDVEELSAEAVGYAGDALPNLTAKSFASSGSDGSGSSSATSNDQTARILAAASSGKSETFALVHPSSTNGGRGVYMYVDEVGRLKCKPPNVRATTLANQCALMVDGDFCGDVFVGAVTVNPRTVNVSFAANELNPNAPWLLQAPMENQAYSAAMADFRNAVEAKKTKISEQERAAIEADFQALMDSVEGLKASAASADPDAGDAEAKLNELERENASLRSNLAGTEEACEGMQRELQRIQTEYNALASTLSGTLDTSNEEEEEY